MKNIAIVTGAGGGLGREFVKLLLPEADELWAISRNRARLDELFIEYGPKVVPVCLDLSRRESIDAVDSMLSQDDYNVVYLVNNAGFAKFGDYADIGVAESLNMIDVNVCATVGLCGVALKKMSGGGKIINVASIAAFQPLPYMNVYAATKAFVRNYTRALNVELKSRGITATAVCPGWMKTGFMERGDIGAKHNVTRFKHPTLPSKVAAKAIADAKKGKDVSVCGGYNKLCHAASKAFTQKQMMRLWLGQQSIRPEKYKGKKNKE